MTSPHAARAHRARHIRLTAVLLARTRRVLARMTRHDPCARTAGRAAHAVLKWLGAWLRSFACFCSRRVRHELARSHVARIITVQSGERGAPGRWDAEWLTCAFGVVRRHLHGEGS
ncbi:hypothetical protein BC628DRAFT_1094776 [Trametes gibbosa]|nr:hypothetical protein BC628DRAFT_1094776 [Trametes gibbosa]